MSRKHNTKHAHTSNGKYEKRLRDRGETPTTVRMKDVVLSDGKRSSDKRGGTGK